MVKKSVYLKRNEKLENKIKFACRFNNIKFDFLAILWYNLPNFKGDM